MCCVQYLVVCSSPTLKSMVFVHVSKSYSYVPYSSSIKGPNILKSVIQNRSLILVLIFLEYFEGIGKSPSVVDWDCPRVKK